jgi:group I intron endonuclease
MWTIYCHTHIATGRRYVGQTTLTTERRWKGHLANARRAKIGWAYFANAIRKYGAEAFSHEVLQVCDTQDAANLAEREWIARFGTTDPARGFNIKPGGQESSPWGDEAHREKLLAALRAPEARAKMSEASRAAKTTPEMRAKVSSEAKARWQDPERRAAQQAAIAAGKAKENKSHYRTIVEKGLATRAAYLRGHDRARHHHR